MVQRLSLHRNITLDSTSANSSPEVCRSTTHLALKKHSLQESNVLRLQRSISAEPEKIVTHESYDGMFSFFFLDCLNMFQDTESILNISTKLNRHCVKSVQIRRFFWSVFSLIRNEYGEILHISLYSVRMWENTDQKKLRIWTLFTQWEATMKTYKATKIKEMHLWWRPFYNKIPSLAEFFRKTFSQNSCEQLVLTTDNRKVMKTLKLSKIRM